MARRVNWLNSIRDWQQEFVGSLSAREFVDCITDDLLGQGVFVFTPSGAVMRLPKVRQPWAKASMLLCNTSPCVSILCSFLSWDHSATTLSA